jgi:hypothetical protein
LVGFNLSFRASAINIHEFRDKLPAKTIYRFDSGTWIDIDGDCQWLR